MESSIDSASINAIRAFDCKIHFEYPPDKVVLLNYSEVSAPKAQLAKIENPLKYIRIDIIGSSYTMDDIINMLNELDDGQLEATISQLSFLDFWLSECFTIAEIKRFFRYLINDRHAEFDRHFVRDIEVINEHIDMFDKNHRFELDRFLSHPKFENRKISSFSIRDHPRLISIVAIRDLFNFVSNGFPTFPSFFDSLISASRIEDEYKLQASGTEQLFRDLVTFVHSIKHSNVNLGLPNYIMKCSNGFVRQRIIAEMDITYNDETDTVKLTFNDKPIFTLSLTRVEMDSLLTKTCPDLY